MTDLGHVAGRAQVRAVNVMVAAAHPMAAAAGAAALREGGNAFDAIVATGATLNVCEPFMSGLAGNGLATCYVAAEGRVRTLDFTPSVPRAFDADRVTGAEMALGPKSPGVPGNLAGWCALNETYGTKPLAELFRSAIGHARSDVPVSALYVQMATLGIEQTFDAAWREAYLEPLGELAVGSVLRQPELAETLEAIAADGPDHLYKGPLGQKMSAHLQAGGGFISMADLEAVAPAFAEPVSVDYRGLRVHTVPPPAESFQAILTLGILAGADLRAMEHLGPDHLDTVFHAIRIAAEVRLANNLKPRPEIEALFEGPHIDRLRARLLDGRPVTGRTEKWGTGPSAETDWTKEHTTSFSAADRDGNLVCITQTLGGPFGSGVVIPGTGVCMSNYLNWGDLEPDSPNRLRPGKPWASVVAPTIATRDGEGVLALGTPGSYGILQTQPQAYVHHVDLGLDLQAAIEAPRGRLWDGRRVELESRVPAATVAELERRGHEIQPAVPLTMVAGGMQAVSRDPASGAMVGAADPRRGGAAVPA